jgi:nitrate/nitrite transporter NarK
VTTPTLSKPGLSGEQISALTMSTLAFAVNFAVWVMFSVIGIKIKTGAGAAHLVCGDAGRRCGGLA